MFGKRSRAAGAPVLITPQLTAALSKPRSPVVLELLLAHFPVYGMLPFDQVSAPPVVS